MHLKDLEAMSEEDNISSVTPQTLDSERDRVCDMIAVSTSGLPTGIGMTLPAKQVLQRAPKFSLASSCMHLMRLELENDKEDMAFHATT